MNEYGKAKYAHRRREAIKYLGGKCVDCGFTNMLEFDHKDPKHKSFDLSKEFASMAEIKLYEEIDKCELRCVGCHSYMTAIQKLGNIDILGSQALR
jgi:hypothetical protein